MISEASSVHVAVCHVLFGDLAGPDAATDEGQVKT